MIWGVKNLKTRGQKADSYAYTRIQRLIIGLVCFLFLSGNSLAAPQENLLKISTVTFRLDSLNPQMMSSRITARGELHVEVKAVTDWKLKWDFLSKNDQISSPLGQEVVGKGVSYQRIPIIWEFDWTTPPGVYEVPINIVLEAAGEQRIAQREVLKLELPFLASIIPQTTQRLHITDDNYLERQITLQIQANAPWMLQVEVTKAHEKLSLLCNSLYHSSTIQFLSSPPFLVLPNQRISLAQGETGGDHQLVLDWQKAPSAPLRAGDYDFYLYFTLLPIKGKAFVERR
jgi:hypothetical protein